LVDNPAYIPESWTPDLVVFGPFKQTANAEGHFALERKVNCFTSAGATFPLCAVQAFDEKTGDSASISKKSDLGAMAEFDTTVFVCPPE